MSSTQEHCPRSAAGHRRVEYYSSALAAKLQLPEMGSDAGSRDRGGTFDAPWRIDCTKVRDADEWARKGVLYEADVDAELDAYLTPRLAWVACRRGGCKIQVVCCDPRPEALAENNRLVGVMRVWHRALVRAAQDASPAAGAGAPAGAAAAAADVPKKRLHSSVAAGVALLTQLGFVELVDAEKRACLASSPLQMSAVLVEHLMEQRHDVMLQLPPNVLPWQVEQSVTRTLRAYDAANLAGARPHAWIRGPWNHLPGGVWMCCARHDGRPRLVANFLRHLLTQQHRDDIPPTIHAAIAQALTMIPDLPPLVALDAAGTKREREPEAESESDKKPKLEEAPQPAEAVVV